VNPLLLWFNQTGSPPNFERFCARWAPWAWVIAFATLAIGVYGALYAVPADAKQGENFRILYLHVPAAWMSLFIYGVMAVQAFIALVWRIKACEILAMACAPVGAVFTVITLATGSIWGRPTWGTWWVWDARLTSELILLFLYLGYMALVAAIDDVRRADKAGALLAIVGVVNVPVIYFSVIWWNTLHQGATLTMGSAPKMAAPMLWAMLLLTLACWAYAFGVAFVRARAIVLEREGGSAWARARFGDGQGM
jgi:heme exporter protein C